MTDSPEEPVSSHSGCEENDEEDDDLYLLHSLKKLGSSGKNLVNPIKKFDMQLVNEHVVNKIIEDKHPELITGTGLVYDEKLVEHFCEWDSSFPERPERITDPYARCCEMELVERCMEIKSVYGTEDQVLMGHSEEHLELLKASVEFKIEELKELCAKFDSIIVNNMTYECSLICLGSVIELVEQVVKKKVRNGFALTRPPGHHAMHNEFNGYSFFNNVGIAAKHAVENLGLERVLIVDWDVHHGQGIQQMFYDDPRVLYFSIHRYEYGTFWPHLRLSDYDFIGEGKGKGFNVNVPLNQIGMTNSDYLAVFQQLLLPIALEFKPDLILVSSGYDAAIGCPEFAPQIILIADGYDSAIGDEKGEMLVTPAMYSHFVHMLSCLAEGRLCVALEGGYCLKSLAEGAALTLRALLGDPVPLIGKTEAPCDSITETILNVIKVLRPFWHCFLYQDDLEENDVCKYSEVVKKPPREGVEFRTAENRPDKFEIQGYYPSRSPEDIMKIESEIDLLIKETVLTRPPHRTCLAFDADMRAHRDISYQAHPECPDRITRIYEMHNTWGLLKRCLKVKSRCATEEEILYVHSPTYLEEMKAMGEKTPLELRGLQSKYNSVYLSVETYRCALLGAGNLLSVVDTVLSGQATNGVAIVRPPGHHAERCTAMGFCFFNNVAIAAKYSQMKYGIKRVLIFDWDIHHGNGTQHMFYEDESVLFMSLHRYDNGGFYPSSPDADYINAGCGKGEGYNVNLAWNQAKMGDDEYIAAFQQIVMPIAYQFNPELVIVSAGFDAARGDPLGNYDVTPHGYAYMTHLLSGLANGRVVLNLEGGYNLHSISLCMATCTSVLLGDPCPVANVMEPCQQAVKCICDAMDTQKQYWNCLKFGVKIPAVAEESILEKFSAESEEEKKKQSTETMEQDGACGGSSGVDMKEFLEGQGYEQMFAVEPREWCPHLEEVKPIPEALQIDVKAPCVECNNVGENWICLICYKVFCSRFVNKHMIEHGEAEKHNMVLSFSDLSVWCYVCNDYIDNAIYTQDIYKIITGRWLQTAVIILSSIYIDIGLTYVTVSVRKGDTIPGKEDPKGSCKLQMTILLVTHPQKGQAYKNKFGEDPPDF